MARQVRKFEYPHLEDHEIEVHTDDDGTMYVERSWSSRLRMMGLALVFVLGGAWFVYNFHRMGYSTPIVAGPALIALFALAGVVAEPIVGSDRSEVVERGGSYYVEMMPVSRAFVAAIGVFVLLVGAALFVGAQGSGSGSGGRQRGAALMAILRAVPFLEYLLLLVAIGLSLLVFNMVRQGETIIYELDES